MRNKKKFIQPYEDDNFIQNNIDCDKSYKNPTDPQLFFNLQNREYNNNKLDMRPVVNKISFKYKISDGRAFSNFQIPKITDILLKRKNGIKISDEDEYRRFLMHNFN